MAQTLKELLAQRAQLDQQIEQAQRSEKAEAIAKVRALMAEYGLSAKDLQFAPRAGKTRGSGPRTGTKVPAKYRDKATGDTWSGRGLQPRWLRQALASGRKLTDFAV
jgi:DNA-binding protein H-NS